MQKFTIKQNFCLGIIFMVIEFMASDLNAQGLTTRSKSGESITIDRIELMPNMPAPYEMRDWKQVAIGYDELVFDLELTGDYLPLIFIRTNNINYPEHESFGLHTVVGTPYQTNGEGINVLPAVISASLVGIDKSSQNGNNWVLMCEEYFNKRPQENVYLNHPSTSSGNDWWYETMPNIFFYQLYDMYPGTGDFEYQFSTVADRWLEAVVAMGGSATPWTAPYMNYRAWYLSSMTPNSSGVTEPEAAGAIAWILYNAFVETDENKYLAGAEWAIEFLVNYTGNPSYELQLPYGAYIAARMNAEIGTSYDIQKLTNWCFTPTGNVRNWGATLGNWGGYDCDGLIGEATDLGYAFIMNGFEQAGALIPMIRYDDRFARILGKWMLNVSNASRLFYPNYLPDENQDSEEWAHQYDPNSYIAHESMRETWLGISPYATGDAISGNWGETNLALYGSSHVGIFGAIIDTTNIPMVLRLDLNKTDYFQNNSYQTYLYFNPYQEEQLVELDLGNDSFDLYDAVSNNILDTYVTGLTMIPIPADSAVLLVLAPAGGILTYDLNKTLINGVVVDYNSGLTVENYPPRIKCLSADKQIVSNGESAGIFCAAEDLDNDNITYTWSANAGTINGNGTTITWIAPDITGTQIITCIIDDGNSGQSSAELSIEVVEFINYDPVISDIIADPRKVDLNAVSQIICSASDENNEELTYTWSSNGGTISGNDDQINWTAPGTEGTYKIFCIVEDQHNGQAIDSISMLVRDFSFQQSGDLVGYYPFNANANDESGFNNNGTAYGATLTNDRFGNPNSAYYFDGINDYILVPNSTILNFQESITLNFLMKIESFYEREAYPISHGSWENRWKVSIVPEKTLRYTVKSDDGIKDLDTETILELDKFYNITCVYNGNDYEIYIDGKLNAFSTFSGLIKQTSIDLLFGQAFPEVSNYNFKGVLDEIRIYNYALSYNKIQYLYNINTSIDETLLKIEHKVILHQNYPNPFNKSTTIQFSVPKMQNVNITIYNQFGELISEPVNKKFEKGTYEIIFNAAKLAGGIYYYHIKAGDFSQTRKMVLIE
jgi:hypothetical protein